MSPAVASACAEPRELTVNSRSPADTAAPGTMPSRTLTMPLAGAEMVAEPSAGLSITPCPFTTTENVPGSAVPTSMPAPLNASGVILISSPCSSWLSAPDSVFSFPSSPDV